MPVVYLLSLLIAPKGIEINFWVQIANNITLLIAPKGIEIC